MLRLFFIGTLLYQFAAQASQSPCSESADESGSSNYEVQFIGPSNTFWSYVDSDPQSWKFKIKSKNGKFLFPKPIMLFAPEIGINEDWTKNFVANGDIMSILPSQLEKFKSHLEVVMKKASSHPRIELTLNFNFPGTVQECKLGIGFNSATVSLPNRKDLTFMKKHKLFVNFRNPKLNEQLPTVLNAKNQYIAKGLPIGEYTLYLEYDSPDISGGFGDFDSIYGMTAGVDCAISIEQRKKLSWIITKNSCLNSKR